ncbi:TonB-dependent receptor [Flavobacterium agricola]|uniref:TonB-dependent receptor n=2 Tax=Flavobacterium agricola TaxID=2870839 RepID=A0ABY6M237_9FLAO|nr:TonB-dependent receptor plug domain-containing protein [Flavobacterium agricola]UYW02579.1 TonB-dependent receptor [Flavobacterium agricola]
MSVNKLTAAEIKQIPVVLGEPDLINALLQLPGVTNSGEGTSGFNVRGGGSDQNLILVDQAPLFNSSHLYGFFSAFNTDAIRDIKLYKGGIPARFGGRGSSVLDINQRSGSDKKFHGNGGIGLLSSRLLLEGPIKKDKTSFLVAGRVSYAHLFLKLSDNDNSVYFYDLNGKLNHKINKNNNLSFTTYFGRDVFQFSDSFKNDYGNTILNLNWNSNFSDDMKSKMALIYSDYVYNLNINLVGFNWKSGITNYAYKWDLENYLSDDVSLKYGINTTYYNFNPGVITPDQPDSQINYYKIPDKRALENAFYAELEHSVFKKFKVNYGLRWSSFFRIGPEVVEQYENNQAVVYDPSTNTYGEANPIGAIKYNSNQVIDQFNNLEPRAALSYIINDNQSVKASYNRMVQYIHLISNTTAATPLDIWAPSGNFIKPQLIDQYALGYFTNLKDNAYSLEIETYYKTGKNRLDYIDGANLIGNRNIERVLLNGHTRSYGLEVLFRKNLGRFTGWISYTLAKSEQQTKGRTNLEPGINNGEWYRTPHDRLHDLSVVANYQYNEKWSFNANFVLQSGRPVTYPVGKYEFQGIVVPRYGKRNQNSLPVYHHLDIAATYKPKSDNKNFQSEWTFGIYNIYNRKNAASISFRENEDFRGKTEAVKLSIFGVIPSVTYNFKF